MTAQFLISDKKIEMALLPIVQKLGINVQSPKTIGELIEKSYDELPKIVVIQNNFANQMYIYDLIRDLRNLFGIYINIVLVISEKFDRGDEIAHCYGLGINQHFTFPFDMGIVEDFFSRHLNKNVFRSFRYRNVPSGGSHCEVSLKIKLMEMNKLGIKFQSSSFYPKRSKIRINFNQILEGEWGSTSFIIVRNYRNTEGNFEYFAEFFELDKVLKKQIIFHLKEQ